MTTETGLSFNDRPVQATRQGERWVCPIDGKELLQLSNGSFTHRPSQGFLAGFGMTLEQFIEEQEKRHRHD